MAVRVDMQPENHPSFLAKTPGKKGITGGDPVKDAGAVAFPEASRNRTGGGGRPRGFFPG